MIHHYMCYYSGFLHHLASHCIITIIQCVLLRGGNWVLSGKRFDTSNLACPCSVRCSLEKATWKNVNDYVRLYLKVTEQTTICIS